MKKLIVFIAITALAISLFALPGCSIVREGITGERQTEAADDADSEEPVVPPKFNIIGDWFGVYSGSEYLSLRFTAGGVCELQPALYPTDMFGPRYYGEYRWGGDDGDEIILDMYKGVSSEVDFGEGYLFEEWTDGGREAATVGLAVTFRVIGGSMKSFALKTDLGGVDTDGYTVVQRDAFLVLLLDAAGGSGSPSPFIFGSEPYDSTEGKKLEPTVPDSFTISAERFFTTAELNVRCGPSTDYGTYGTVPIGTPVEKIGYMTTGHDEWAFVLLNDGGGWVHTDYLSGSPPAPVTNTNDDGGDGE